MLMVRPSWERDEAWVFIPFLVKTDALVLYSISSEKQTHCSCAIQSRRELSKRTSGVAARYKLIERVCDGYER